MSGIEFSLMREEPSLNGNGAGAPVSANRGSRSATVICALTALGALVGAICMGIYGSEGQKWKGIFGFGALSLGMGAIGVISHRSNQFIKGAISPEQKLALSRLPLTREGARELKMRAPSFHLAATRLQRRFLQRHADQVNPSARIQRNYLPNLHQEYRRLEALGLFNPFPRDIPLDPPLNAPRTWANPWAEMTLERKVLLGRALEMARVVQGTHYTFTYSQGLGWAMLTDLNTEVERSREEVAIGIPSVRARKCFRAPGSVRPNCDFTNVAAFFEGRDSKRIDDHRLTDLLVSVDGYKYSTQPMESCLYFFDGPGSVHSYDSYSWVGLEWAQSSFRDKRVQDYFVAHMTLLADQFREWGAARISLVCLPKHLVQDPQTRTVYPSHSGGSLCQDHPPAREIELLEAVQRGDMSEACATQYRLLIHAVDKERRNQVFAYSCRQADYDQAMAPLMQLARFFSRLQAITHKTSAEEFVTLFQEMPRGLIRSDEGLTAALKDMLAIKKPLLDRYQGILSQRLSLMNRSFLGIHGFVLL